MRIGTVFGAARLASMTTPAEFLKLAVRFDRAAKEASDPGARNQLEMVADTYVVLAKSTLILERSAAAFEKIRRPVSLRNCKADSS